MKKLSLTTKIILISILSAPLSVFASNAALVASIHDDPMTRVITVSDIIDTAYPISNVETTGGEGISSKIFRIDITNEESDISQQNIEATTLPLAIHSEEELENFVKTLTRGNKEIVLVTVATDTVSLTRRMPVKLFGMIDLSAKETVQVISWGDGTNAVEVKSPWWGIFSTYSHNNNALSNNVYTRMKAIPPTLFSPTLSPTTKARIITEIQNAFNENTGDLSKSASVSSN